MKLSFNDKIKSIFSPELLFSILVITLFFPIRHVYLTKSAYITGAYSDFTSFSLYLSDIITILLGVWLFLINKEHFSLQKSVKILLLWLILDYFINFNKNQANSLYYLGKFLELLVAYGTTVVLASKNAYFKRFFVILFVILTSIQSIMALTQFIIQQSIGLKLLGEQIIRPEIMGVAKIIVNFQPKIRGYGTFPHPNPLAAFIVIGILLSLYLYGTSRSKTERIILGCLLFTNFIGLTVTFSRGAWIALLASVLLYFAIFAFYKYLDKRTISLLWLTIISIIVVILIFKPYISSRAKFLDSAAPDRIFYDKIGLKENLGYPIFGLGIGNSVPMMQHFAPRELTTWEYQPAHNYFLLAAAELGIIGSIILAWVFIWHLLRLWQLIRRERGTGEHVYQISLFVSLISILLLMQIDHYFYTLEQTQLLLWVILGLIAAEIYQKAPKQS